MRDRVLLAVVLMSALSSSRLFAGGIVGYGEIQIEIVSVPGGDARHGYGEYSFLVYNNSDEAHVVTLVLPDGSYGSDHEIGAIRRTETVGAKNRKAIVLLQPPSPPCNGRQVRVLIDGKSQEEPLPVDVRNIVDAYAYGYYSPKAPGADRPLIRVGPAVPNELIDAFRNRAVRVLEKPIVPTKPNRGEKIREVKMEVRPGEPPGAVGEPTSNLEFNVVRGEGSMKTWSRHWLGLSRYDGIVLARGEVLDMTSEGRSALWQYVEAGGSLLIVGKTDVAEGWTALESGKESYKVYKPGFGVCVMTDFAHSAHTPWPESLFRRVGLSWRETGLPVETNVPIDDAHEKFPVIDDIGIPVRGLFVIMLLFAVVIGPVNVVVLTRWKRRIWLLWTVPTMSFLTVLAVFGFMFLSEGWSRHVRTEAITVLDESTRRATTVGWTGFYSPVTPGDGLLFSQDTEATMQGSSMGHDPYSGRRRRAGTRSCTIEWSDGQHFEKGWVTARIPVFFQVRKSEPNRKRVEFETREGGVTASNGLGCAIRTLWYADDKGKVFRAEDVESGAKAVLTPVKDVAAVPTTESNLRDIYASDWQSAARKMREKPEQYLRPRTYIADVDESPFLEDALRRAKERRCRCIVYGLSSRTEP